MKRFAGVLLAFAAIVLLVVRFWPEAAGPSDAQVLSAPSETAAQELPESEILEGRERQALEVVEAPPLEADALPTLSAIVETEYGAPAMGATVSARWEGGSGEWTTDESGRVPAVESAVFPSTWTATLGSQAARLELEEAPPSGEIALRLRESGTLRGRVFREDGEYAGLSLQEVLVSVWPAGQGAEPFGSAWCNSLGEFEVVGLPIDTRLAVHAGGGGFTDRGPMRIANVMQASDPLEVPLNYLLCAAVEPFPLGSTWEHCMEWQQGRIQVHTVRDQNGSFLSTVPNPGEPESFAHRSPVSRSLRLLELVEVSDTHFLQRVRLYSSSDLTSKQVTFSYQRDGVEDVKATLDLELFVDAFVERPWDFTAPDVSAPKGSIQLHVRPPAGADLVDDDQLLGTLLINTLDYQQHFEVPFYGRDLEGCRIECLPLGHYEFQLDLRTGLNWPIPEWSLVDGKHVSTLPKAVVSEETAELHLDLSPLAVAIIDVVDSEGQPVEGRHHFSMGRGDAPSPQARSYRVSGTWFFEGSRGVFFGLRPGAHWLVLKRPGTPGLDFTKVQEFEVNAGEAAVRLTFEALEGP